VADCMTGTCIRAQIGKLARRDFSVISMAKFFSANFQGRPKAGSGRLGSTYAYGKLRLADQHLRYFPRPVSSGPFSSKVEAQCCSSKTEPSIAERPHLARLLQLPNPHHASGYHPSQHSRQPEHGTMAPDLVAGTWLLSDPSHGGGLRRSLVWLSHIQSRTAPHRAVAAARRRSPPSRRQVHRGRPEDTSPRSDQCWP
jgi:hypothetical protein